LEHAFLYIVSTLQCIFQPMANAQAAECFLRVFRQPCRLQIIEHSTQPGRKTLPDFGAFVVKRNFRARERKLHSPSAADKTSAGNRNMFESFLHLLFLPLSHASGITRACTPSR